MKKLVSLLLCILMLTTTANFSSIVNAVTTVESSVSEETTETVNNDEEISETEEVSETEDVSETEEATEEVAKDELVDKTITGYFNGYVVEVSGMLPAVATLSLTSVDDETAQKLVLSKRTDGKAIFACDIKVIGADGNEWQPNETVNVKVSGIDETEKEINFLHISEDVNTVLSEENPADSINTIVDVTKGEKGELSFETRSFSTFVGFTVDFHYNGNKFSINGLESVLLSEVFKQLEIDRDVADVADVTFTNSSLIRVEKQGDDWLLSSLDAFQTNENLKVTFKDGNVLDIAVTDAVTWNDGASISGTSYSSNTEIIVYGDVILKDVIEMKSGYKLTITNGTNGDVTITRDGQDEFFYLSSSTADLEINADGSGTKRIILDGNGYGDAIVSAAGGSTSGTDIDINYTVFKDSTGKGVYIGDDIQSCELNNCAFESVTSSSIGGAMVIKGAVNEQVTLNNCAFQNCTTSSTGGGAIAFDSGAVLSNGFVLNYDDEFENTRDSSGNTFTSAFLNCSTSSTTSTDRRGGAIRFANTGTSSLPRFLVHIEPGVMDSKHIFDGCKAYASGVFHVVDIDAVDKIIFDYGYYDASGNIILDDNKATAVYDKDLVKITDITAAEIAQTDINAYDVEKSELSDLRSGATFKDCYATYRGGVSFFHHDDVTSHDQVLFDGVIAQGCQSTDGAVINLQKTVINDFTYRDCIFRENKAICTVASTAGYYGGSVLRTAGATAAAVTINNSLFHNNESFWSGGAVYWNAGNVDTLSTTAMTIKNSHFLENHAAFGGGAIFNESDMSISNTKIVGNSALCDGGGIRTTIYNNSAGVNWKRNSVDLNFGKGVVVEDNFAGGFGGGVAIDIRYSMNAHANWHDPIHLAVNFNMYDTWKTGDDLPDGVKAGDKLPDEYLPKLSGNVAGICGGGLYYGLGIAELDNGTLDGGHDSYYSTSTETLSNISDSSFGDGGTSSVEQKQMLVNSYEKNINIDGGVISDNEAGYDGGGIYANVDNTIVNVTNGLIIGNKAGVTNTVRKYITDSSQQINFDCSNFLSIRQKVTGSLVYEEYQLDHNVNGYGGGICLRGAGSELNISGGNFGMKNDEAADGDDKAAHKYGNRADFGGAIAVNEGTLNIINSETAAASGEDHGNIEYNYALGGGGIFTISSGTVNIQNGDIDFNHSDANGTNNAVETVTTTGSKNTTLVSGTISEIDGLRPNLTNVKSGCGGGVYANGTGKVNISGGNIYNNRATDGAGGGVFCGYGGDVTMTGGLLYKNVAEATKSSSSTTAFKDQEIKGVGGAVAVGKGASASNTSSYTLNEPADGILMAIYDNTATFAADDVYASGQNTDLELPNTADMDIPNVNNVKQSVGWFEDFHDNDPEFDNSISNSSVTVQSNVQRYKTGTVKTRVPDVTVATISGRRATNDANTYVCMTLGIVEAGGLEIGKTVTNEEGKNFNLSYDEWFEFTITVGGKYVTANTEKPVFKGVYKMKNGEIEEAGDRVADEGNFEWINNPATATQGSVYRFRIKNGYYARFDCLGNYTIAESYIGSQAQYVSNTFYRLKDGKDASYNDKIDAESTGSMAITEAEPKEIEFINVMKAIQFSIKYYNRKAVNGKPADMEDTPKTAYAYFMGNDLYSCLAAGPKALSDQAISRVKDYLPENLIDEYQTYTNSEKRQDQYGRSTGEDWLTWYAGNTKVDAGLTESTLASVTSAEVWVKNVLKKYQIYYYNVTSNATKLTECTFGEGTNERKLYLNNSVPGGMIEGYYNQRVGVENSTSDNNANLDSPDAYTNHLNMRGKPGFTGKTVETKEEITYNGQPLYFSHWSYEDDGTSVVSTQLEFKHRISNDRSLYAIYTTEEDKINDYGLSAITNNTDSYSVVGADSKEVAYTRLNTLASAYYFKTNSLNVINDKLAAIYVVGDGSSVSHLTVQALQPKIVEILNANSGKSKISAGISGVPGVKGVNIYVYDNPAYTNQNRVNIATNFTATNLSNKNIFVFAGLNFEKDGKTIWQISDNGIDYRFDEAGNQISANSVYKESNEKSPEKIEIIGTATGGSASTSKEMTKVSSGTTATYEVDLKAGTYTFKIKETTDGNGVTFGATNAVINNKTDAYLEMSDTVTSEVTLNATGGRYIFTYDYFTNKIKIVHKVPKVTIAGTTISGEMTPVEGTTTVTFETADKLAATTHTFSILETIDSDSVTLGSNTTINNQTDGVQLSTSVGSCSLKVNSEGKYTFVYDYTTDTLTVSPDIPAIAIVGTNGLNATADDMSFSGTTATYTVKLTAGTYQFNITENGVTYGLSSATIFTNTTSALSFNSSYTNKATLNAYGGTYTFSYNYETNQLTISHIPPTITLEYYTTDDTTDRFEVMTLSGTTATARTEIIVRGSSNYLNFRIKVDDSYYYYSGSSFEVKSSSSTYTNEKSMTLGNANSYGKVKGGSSQHYIYIQFDYVALTFASRRSSS